MCFVVVWVEWQRDKAYIKIFRALFVYNCAGDGDTTSSPEHYQSPPNHSSSISDLSCSPLDQSYRDHEQPNTPHQSDPILDQSDTGPNQTGGGSLDRSLTHSDSNTSAVPHGADEPTSQEQPRQMRWVMRSILPVQYDQAGVCPLSHISQSITKLLDCGKLRPLRTASPSCPPRGSI